MLEFFKPRNSGNNILKVKSYEYCQYHKGIDGNIAYYANAKFCEKDIVVELVHLPDKRWCFHVEQKGKMLLDSRLGNCYYDSAEKAHSAMVNSLSDKYNNNKL